VTGRTKARLALAGLGLVVAGFALALGLSEPARVRFWAWRMRSGDLRTRREARLKLLQIRRPAIDDVYADLVAGEVCDRLAGVVPEERVVFVGSPGMTWGHPHEQSYMVRVPLHSVGPVFVCDDRIEDSDALVERLDEPDSANRWLVAGHAKPGSSLLQKLLVVPVPESDPLSASVVEETRSRVAAR